MQRETVFAHTAGCYSGEPASCTYACPFRLDLRSFLKKSAKGRWAAAYKELRAAVLFPTVTAALCPRPCEDACQRKTVLGGDAIAVGLLERACLDHTNKREAAAYVVPPRSERVAVVGAGPAGLSFALLLAQKRLAVTVYDRAAGWGGHLRGHPDFPAFDTDFALQFSTVECGFVYDTEITSLDTLADFDAVFLATGADGEHFGLLDSRDPVLSATGDPRVFLGGERAGLPLVEGMAGAARAAGVVEAFLQSGTAALSGESWDRGNCTRYAPHPDVPQLPRVQPSGGRGYGEAEARAEAARCLQCDCTACMDACELLGRYRKKPPRIANDVFLDSGGRNSVSSACITRQTWSCSLCGRCGRKCREGADLRGLFQLSRADRVADGRYPPAIHHHWLREMDHAVTRASLARTKSGPRCTHAFFPGCRLGAADPAYVLRAYDRLRRRHDMGLLLDCCGVPAWWAGEQALFEAHVQRLRGRWQSLGNPVLVTACPTCARVLGEYLPQAQCVSLYTMLEADSPPAAPPFARAAVFDPCAAADGEERAAVRRLAEGCGVSVTEYDSDGKCCGFGGHMQLADTGLYDEITAARAGDSADPYIVYCANCREVFAAGGKECRHILDLVFGLPPREVPTLEEKRDNSMRLKRELGERYWGEVFEAACNPWDGLRVELTPQVQANMERRLISLGDVRETIWSAEQAGEGFARGDGALLCSLDAGAVTYWVGYRREEDAGGVCYRVSSVYAHRMRVREGG